MEITSGKQWRTGEAHMLPSGKVAALRRPSVLTVATRENAPQFLKSLIMDAIQGRKQKEGFDMTPENLKMLAETLDRLCVDCFASPRIVDNPQEDDEIAITDLDDADKMDVFQWWAGGMVALAQSFRPQPLEGVGVVPDGANVPAAPVGTPGHNGA